MEGGRDRNKETWRVWLWAAVFCLCVLGLATGCGPQNGQHVEGTSQTEMPDESESQVDEVLTAGTGAEDPIPAEPGMRLLEGIYYSCDIDAIEDVEIFCYLGSQDNGFPRFEVDGIPMTMTGWKMEKPLTETMRNEAGIDERWEVYYLTDIREGDGQLEFALLDQGETSSNQTVFCNYERSQIHWIDNVEGFPFGQEHDEHCSAREVVGLDGQGHIVSTFALDLGQLWSATQAWELLTGNSIVKVEPEDGLYEGLAHGCTVDEGGIDYPNPANGRVFAPYVGRELEVYVEPAKDAEIAVWKEGTVIMTHTDNEHWIRLERADGEAGWIYLEAPEVLAQSHGLTYVDYAIYDLKPLAWKYSKLPYEEIWSAMQEKALQNEPITVEVKPEGTQLSSGVLYQADLDDDGEMEQFYYAGAIHRENSRPLFIIDGKEYEIGSGFLPVIFWGSRNYLGMYYEEYYLCDIQPGDGQMEFAIGDESDASACHETDWLSFDGTWMRYIGTMDGFPFTQYQGDSEWTYKIRNGIWGLDGQGHVGTYQQMGILDKLWADVVWELNPDTGMLELMEPEDGWYINNQSRYIPFQGGYSNDNWSVYYLQNDMPLYRKPDLNAEPFVMKVQAPGYRERICLTHTDGEHWVRIENPEGESGWFYLDGWRLVLPDPKAKTVFSHYIQQVFVYRTWGEEGNQDGIVDGIDSIVIGTQAAEKYPFLQQEAEAVTLSGTEMQLMSANLYSADLDGDGRAEEFAYCGLESGGNESGYYGATSLYPTFLINGKRVQSGYSQADGYTEDMKNQWGNVLDGQRFYLCDLRQGDGQWELAVLDPGPSGDPVTTFLCWDGNDLKLVGRVIDFPFAQENDFLAEEYANGTYGLDGRGNVTIRARANILQTWWIRETWRVNRKSGQLELVVPKDGLFENTNPYYYRDYIWQGSNDYKGLYPHLMKDLPLYRQPDQSAETFVMEAAIHGVDNKIYFTHTDNEHWVRVEDDAGESGWFYLDSFTWLITEEGKINIYDVIGGLNTAD